MAENTIESLLEEKRIFNPPKEFSEELKIDLVEHVRNTICPIAKPDKLQFADALPKTRSGKIMRRILRKIASGEVHDLGDVTTLADPSVVEVLVRERE
jgi:acetyl-CoA synthetase